MRIHPAWQTHRSLADQLRPQHHGSLSRERVPPFYVYDLHGLRFSWLHACPRVQQCERTSQAERLAEVHLHALLQNHPQRTRNASRALLFVVPVWEWVSYIARECNGTTHQKRMSHAASVLHGSPHFKARAGLDHLFVSSAALWGTETLTDRLGLRLARMLRLSTVGRPHPYSSSNVDEGVGRCTLELPYLSNAHALARRPHVEHRRRWMLLYRGGLRVCCEPGRSVRKAIGRLAARLESAGRHRRARLVVAERGRQLNATNRSQLLREQYRLQGEEMAESDFCLCPAGDTVGTSRFYSAIAAGCIPVVVANQLAGAFASHVPYERFVLRAEHKAFVQNPELLLERLSLIDQPAILSMRRALDAYAADVIYDWPGSRVVSNLLRTAWYLCVQDAVQTTCLSISASRHAPAELGGLPCLCTNSLAEYTWPANRSYAYPADVCRCHSCGRACASPF